MENNSGKHLKKELGVFSGISLVAGMTTYLAKADHPLAGFVNGCSGFLRTASGAISSLALAAVTPFQEEFAFSEPVTKAIAIGLIVLFTIINLRGIKTAAAIQNISMVLRLVPLVLVIVLGVFAGKSQPDLSLATAFTTDTPPTFFNIVKVIGYATFASLWAYAGWTNLNTVAGEMKRPKRDLPLAIIISMGGIMLIYTLFNFAVYRIIPQAEVNSMIADGNIYLGKTAAFNVMGNFGKWIVLIGMAVGIVGTVNGDCLVFPRTYYAMARGGFFFKKCGEVNDKGIPAFAIIASSAMSIILVLFNSLQQLTDWLVTVSALLNLMAIFAVLIFRKKYPDMERPYKVWGGIPVIILTCLLFVVLLVNNFVEDPLTSAKGLIIIALCIPFYYIFRKLNGGMEYDTDKIDN